MTKKHFNALAAALAGSKPIPENNTPVSSWMNCCVAVADVCAQSKPNFDRSRFYEACGIRFEAAKAYVGDLRDHL